MMLDQLIAGLDIRVVRGDARRARVSDLTEDSRTVLPGSMFVARKGLASDGRRFVGEACVLGASVILSDDASLATPPGVVLCVCENVAQMAAQVAERFYGAPSSSLVLIGVTGTNGKTTVAYVAHRILNRCGVRCGLIGTVLVDDGRETAPAAMTTPPAIELSRTLATMVESGCRACVMEVSSHALAQGRVDGLKFDAAVFTNLTQDHGDYHESKEDYLQAKRRLFELLPAGGVGIVNADDAASAQFRADRLVRCSSRPGADWWVEVCSQSLAGMELSLVGGDEKVRCTTGMFGAYNAMNVLQAYVAARTAVDVLADERAMNRLGSAVLGLKAPPGRLERISGPGDDVTVFVDYAHTPDALKNVLSALRSVSSGGRICVVFGCGGDRDRSKRAEMGRVAGTLADRVIVTSDNPRHETPGAIVSEILGGLSPQARAQAEVHVQRKTAIECAIVQALPGDIVLIAGKGHERVQIVPDGCGGVMELPFDDAVEAAAALRTRREQEASRT